ncbi:MAG: GNAT family protein [Chloroflexota bacterium]|nr:GNAT family protein [Chloroflexota bacterium]
MFPQVQLNSLTREDVERVAEWLNDPEVNSLWFGEDENGEPLHMGYSPTDVLNAPEAKWDRSIPDEEHRKVFSVYSSEGEHIGEGQLEFEWPLLEAQLLLIIGRKDLWHHHYGTSALVALLDEAYDSYGLHRVWVDVPEYNEHALRLCRHVGFVLEGHFRKTHRKGDTWYDSFAMGLLSDEYLRRRNRLMELEDAGG